MGQRFPALTVLHALERQREADQGSTRSLKSSTVTAPTNERALEVLTNTTWEDQ